MTRHSTGARSCIQLDRDADARARSNDRCLEAAINEAYNALISAHTEKDRQAASINMVTLVAQRSPQQVRRMEIERGLTCASPDTTFDRRAA